MERSEEALAVINNVKTKLNELIEKQREVNGNIENMLNMANQNKVQVVCKGECGSIAVIDSNIDLLTSIS